MENNRFAEERRRQNERYRRNHDKKRPVRYYSYKIGGAILKYGLAYPFWGGLWVVTMLCMTGRPPFSHGWCGTGRRQARQEEIRRLRRKRNLPRPLYRCKDVDDPDNSDNITIDEVAISRRRRLSFGSEDHDGGGRLLSKPGKMLNRAKNVLAQRRDRGREKNGEQPFQRCRLLELPPEIRTLIWKLVVGNNRALHMFYGMPIASQPFVVPLKATLFPIRIKRIKQDQSMVRRLSCVECIHRPSPNGWENLHPDFRSCDTCGILWNPFGECAGRVVWSDIPAAIAEGRVEFTDSREMGKIEIVPVEDGWRPLALISTCRQIYNEAIDILYNDNTFHFPINHNHQGLTGFISTLLPQRLNRVTRISTSIFPHPETLEQLLRIVSRHLPNLAYLEFTVRIARRPYVPAQGDVYCEIFSGLIRNLRSRVSHARVVWVHDWDSYNMGGNGFQTPEGLEVLMAPEGTWERRGRIMDALRHGNLQVDDWFW
ncbi:hypothetical protein F5Y16DRAFT_370260 [Xylariaceae sp. FL0255]|nr:hypothetical protein F5Y16DRAFT_370260 [Xylariaceae sp. FL0255]